VGLASWMDDFGRTVVMAARLRLSRLRNRSGDGGNYGSACSTTAVQRIGRRRGNGSAFSIETALRVGRRRVLGHSVLNTEKGQGSQQDLKKSRVGGNSLWHYRIYRSLNTSRLMQTGGKALWTRLAEVPVSTGNKLPAGLLTHRTQRGGRS